MENHKSNGKEAAAVPSPVITELGVADIDEALRNHKISVSPSALKLAMLEQHATDKYSLDYIIEECLVNGLKARRRSREYAQQSNNRLMFQKELQTNPALAADPVALASLVKKYKLV